MSTRELGGSPGEGRGGGGVEKRSRGDLRLNRAFVNDEWDYRPLNVLEARDGEEVFRILPYPWDDCRKRHMINKIRHSVVPLEVILSKCSR